MEEKLISDEETERPDKLKTFEIETDEDLKTLDEDSETEDHEPEPEQALEFLTGGERYTQD